MSRVRTRFAPSPTGDLHVGGAYVALASWVLARRAGGAFVVRMEDLDLPRVVPGSAERILDDLRWLGLGWDEGPRVGGPCGPYDQSARFDFYAARIAALAERGLVYPCDCSRAEIARAASAPHAGEEVHYSGHCAQLSPDRPPRRPFSQRLRLPDTECTFIDLASGPFAQSLARDVGDFVLRRGDGLFTYQLAVAADDQAMGITHVVRGADLLPSTPRQLFLMQCWAEAGLCSAPPPRYVHLPLVVDSSGERLAKRTRGARVRALREAGIAAEEVLGVLAHALGLCSDEHPRTADELSHGDADPSALRWPREHWRIPAHWAEVASE